MPINCRQCVGECILGQACVYAGGWVGGRGRGGGMVIGY